MRASAKGLSCEDATTAARLPPCTQQSWRKDTPVYAAAPLDELKRLRHSVSVRHDVTRAWIRARGLLVLAAGLVKEPTRFAGEREISRETWRTGGEIAGAARGRAARPESARTGRCLNRTRGPWGGLPTQYMGAEVVAFAFEAGAAAQSAHLGGLTLRTSGTIVHRPREGRAIEQADPDVLVGLCGGWQTRLEHFIADATALPFTGGVETKTQRFDRMRS